MMFKELKTVLEIVEKLKPVLENSNLKEKWEKEKKIVGRIVIDKILVDFVIKEVDRNGE